MYSCREAGAIPLASLVAMLTLSFSAYSDGTAHCPIADATPVLSTCDINGDGVVNDKDIDLVGEIIDNKANVAIADLDADNDVDKDDYKKIVRPKRRVA